MRWNHNGLFHLQNTTKIWIVELLWFDKIRNLSYVQESEPIGICEMLFQSSLIALVGDSEDAKLTARKLHFVNTKKGLICEFNFATPILGVKMNKKRYFWPNWTNFTLFSLVVVLETKILVYDIQTTKLIHSIETCLNPKGFFCFRLTNQVSVLCLQVTKIVFLHILKTMKKGKLLFLIYWISNRFTLSTLTKQLSLKLLSTPPELS